jgi:RNA polymerase sigma-70 factor (ECF subfamily)
LKRGVIHSMPYRVAVRMTATPHPLHGPQAQPRPRSWGVVLAFRRGLSNGSMIQATATSDGLGHAALIEAIAQRRDRAAFAQLFAYFGPRVKAWMLRAGASPAAAEELAQETMLAVWQKADRFEPDRASASTWIFTIARNQRIDAVRREHHPSELLPDPSRDPEAPPSADHIVAMSQQEIRVRSALSLLPAEQAEVIRKAFFEDKVHSAIEQELGIPLGTVKSRLRLAMARLRAVLGDLA